MARRRNRRFAREIAKISEFSSNYIEAAPNIGGWEFSNIDLDRIKSLRNEFHKGSRAYLRFIEAMALPDVVEEDFLRKGSENPLR